MKRFMVAAAGIVFLSGCAELGMVTQVPISGPVEEKAITAVSDSLNEERVEVLEATIAKTPSDLPDYGIIIIKGKAKYYPPKIGKKEFQNGWFVFNLLDARGKLVRIMETIPDCGDYGNIENVEPEKPFEFNAEKMIPKEQWQHIVSYKYSGYKSLRN